VIDDEQPTAASLLPPRTPRQDSHSTHPWVCPVEPTREMHALVSAMICSKGPLYVGELLDLIHSTEGAAL
jgi:hypothetical protein